MQSRFIKNNQPGGLATVSVHDYGTQLNNEMQLLCVFLQVLSSAKEDVLTKCHRMKPSLARYRAISDGKLYEQCMPLVKACFDLATSRNIPGFTRSPAYLMGYCVVIVQFALAHLSRSLRPAAYEKAKGVPAATARRVAKALKLDAGNPHFDSQFQLSTRPALEPIRLPRTLDTFMLTNSACFH